MTLAQHGRDAGCPLFQDNVPIQLCSVSIVLRGRVQVPALCCHGVRHSELACLMLMCVLLQGLVTSGCALRMWVSRSLHFLSRSAVKVE